MGSCSRSRCLLTAVLLAIGCTAAGSAAAQYPERPVRLVVPQAAGSATDNVARTLASEREAMPAAEPVTAEVPVPADA